MKDKTETFKEYDIKNVQDMINVVNEKNLSNFIKDLKGVLMTAILIKDETGEVPQCASYMWIDDDKHNIEVKLEISINKT